MSDTQPRSRRCILVMLALAGTGASFLSASAVALTSTSITPVLRPSRLGARAALTVTVHFRGGEFGVPAAGREWVLRLPAGMTLDVPRLRSCVARRLRTLGGRGCPAQSRIGSGHALAAVHAGSQVLIERVGLSAFIGLPQGWDPTFIVLGQGYTPLDERVVLTGQLMPDGPPYGEKLVMSVPPIPTLSLEPQASVLSFSLTVGASRQGSNSIIVPAKCPRGGFPFAGEFTYSDASTDSVESELPCPR